MSTLLSVRPKRGVGANTLTAGLIPVLLAPFGAIDGIRLDWSAYGRVHYYSLFPLPNIPDCLQMLLKFPYNLIVPD